MKKMYFLAISLFVVLTHVAARIFIFPSVSQQGGKIEVLPFFNLVEVWNPGISFGMFSNLAYGQWLLSGLSVGITIMFAFFLREARDRLSVIACCLIIGGAIGNIFDRVRFGAVADYLDFHLAGYHWPAFNITDTAIVIGVALLLSASIFKKRLNL